MRNDLQQHKKSDKIKWIATAVAFVILGTAVLATATKGFKDWKPWKDTKQEQSIDENSTQEAGAYDENGNNLADGNIHDMPLALTFTGAKATASSTSNDITTNEDGTKEVTVQATLNREIEMLFDWSVAWTDSTAPEMVTDYVTVTPQSDGSAIAKIKMKRLFPHHITLMCESRSITGLKATCAVDCRPRTLGISVAGINYSLYGHSGLKMTDSPTSVNIPSVVVPKVTAENGSTYSVSYLVALADTLGSYTGVEYFDNLDVSIEFYDLAETEGYGFNPLFKETGLVLTTDMYKWTAHGSRITLTENSIKEAFYYDESTGRTADDFYSYGLALLKGETGSVTMKCVITGNIKESLGGGTLSTNYYFKLDLTNLEGLSIDINGMEDILF